MKIYFSILLLIFTLSIFAQDKPTLDSLTIVLEKGYKTDQEPRLEINDLQTKYGANSQEVKDKWVVINRQDSINQQIVTSIIDKYGWLSVSETSAHANTALFTVIQHAPVEMQIKYLPVLQQAIKNGKAKPSYYAYLSDRINMHQDKFQAYGTQIGGNYKGEYMLWPVADELNVNQRRKALGMEPIEEYVKNFNFKYMPPKVDYLKGNVIVNGFISAKKGDVSAVKFFSTDNALLAKTNSDGVFRVIVKRAMLTTPFVVEMEGNKKMTVTIQDKGEDVFNVFAVFDKE